MNEEFEITVGNVNYTIIVEENDRGSDDIFVIHGDFGASFAFATEMGTLEDRNGREMVVKNAAALYREVEDLIESEGINY